MSATHETIIPLIEACRILNTCTDEQSVAFCSQIFDNLLNHQIVTKSKDLVKLLCSIHTMLSPHMIDGILQLVSSKKNQINDTISVHSEVDANSNTLNNIVEMPTELLIHTFQYLPITDIYQVEKTCRLLCTISRNPQCLTTHDLSLKLADRSDYHVFAYYNHIRYSKIRSLHLPGNEWGEDYINNLLRVLPQFQHLKGLRWNNLSPELPRDVNDYISRISNFLTLEIVQINWANATNVFDVISKSHNLQILMLADIIDEGDALTNKISEWMSQTNDNPFPYLQQVTIERHSTNWPAVQKFIYWILAQGDSNKKLSILDHHDLIDRMDQEAIDDTYLPQFFDSYTNDEIAYNLQKIALKNVSELVLGIYDYHLVKNLSNWIDTCKEIKFQSFTMDTINVYLNGALDGMSSELIQPLHNIVSISEHSSFRWTHNYLYISEFIHEYVEWICPISIDGTYKHLLNNWPIYMISNISNKSELFDSFTLSIYLDHEYGGISELEELVEAWFKLKKLLKINVFIQYNAPMYMLSSAAFRLQRKCNQVTDEELKIVCRAGSLKIEF